MSRSEFYKKATEDYLENGVEREMIRRINKVCEEVDTSLDPLLRRYVINSLSRLEWNEA